MSPVAPASGGSATRYTAAFLLFLALGTAIGLAPRLLRNRHLSAVAAEEARQLPTVTVVHPSADLATDLVLPSTIEAVEQTVVNARATGFVRRRLVDIGDFVKKGQVLAILSEPDADAQYREAQANYRHALAGTSQAAAGLAAQQASTQQAQALLAQASGHLEQAVSDRDTAEDLLSEAQNTLTSQSAGAEKARASLVLARKTFNRYETLLRQGFVTQQDADTYRANLDSARATFTAAVAQEGVARTDVSAKRDALRSADAIVAQARSALAAAQDGVSAAQASRTAATANVVAAREEARSTFQNAQYYQSLIGYEKIVAPFDGVITARNVDVGTLVKADNVPTNSSPSGLFGIARLRVMRVLVNVPQAYLPYVHAGDPAHLEVREFPNRKFNASVYRVAGGLDPAARTVQVEVRIDNPDGTLRPGMYVETRLDNANRANVLRIPSTALIFDEHGTRVATVTPNRRIHFVRITIQRDLGAYLAVSRGLTPEMLVVTNPTDDLTEKGRVTTVSAAPPARATASPVASPSPPTGASKRSPSPLPLGRSTSPSSARGTEHDH